MDLRLERAGSALGNFLETDISGSYLGLGKDALSHLERFRSFLHQFYVGQHGYWPPTPLDRNGTGFPRAIYRSMYFDFQGLYEYLVDSSSGTSIQDNKPVDGGICVYQNISAFDKRHKYPSLPHSLPLIPKVPAQLNKEKPLSRLFGNKQAEQRRRLASSAALSIATNPTKKNVMNCPLVHQYYQFEHQWTVMEGSTVSCANARKVRWILVYAILQILISVTRAPKEVRDTESVSYPLCCQIAGTPPWQTDEKGEKLRPALQATRPLSFQETLLELGPDMDILSAKPSPLIIKKSPSPPHKVSIIHELSVKSPKPIRTASFEFLNEKSSDVSLIDYDSASPPQPGDVRPTERKPSPHCHNSDPTTPSTSEADSGHGGWSASSSDDGMDHHSVNGSDSNYGDGKDEEMPRNSARPSPAKRSSIGSFRPCSCNPEVDQYVRS